MPHNRGSATEHGGHTDQWLQMNFAGWVQTRPLVFSDLFDQLHADKGEQWQNPYSHGDGVVSEYREAWQRDLSAFGRAFPNDGIGYRLRLDSSGPAPRIAWLRQRTPPPQAALPFEAKFRNPAYRHDVAHDVPIGATLHADDGWLVCHNDGEFGAWLNWYSNDGQESYEVAPLAWVDCFFRFGGRLFAIGGLSHLSGDNGTVIELAKVGDRWKAVRTVHLAQRASLATPMTDTSFLVVCTATLVEVSLDGSTRYLYGLINCGSSGDGTWGRMASWGLYSPSSVVVHEGHVYIGTAFGVVVVKLRGWDSTEWWLVPGEQFAQIEEHFKLSREPRIPAAADHVRGQGPVDR